ncbi:hypothetical protein [Streptomyces sp. NPDC046197]|uniref:hypothetical protein n=1 Tax=Streptomyces sp. NPDC046197 TaxID=3154337 RepID=UPI00340AB97F
MQDSFRGWLSSSTGVDLEGAALEVNVSLREPGDYRNVHRGKTDRAMNAVFVLNEQWPQDGGGTYDLWEARERPSRPVASSRSPEASARWSPRTAPGIRSRP